MANQTHPLAVRTSDLLAYPPPRFAVVQTAEPPVCLLEVVEIIRNGEVFREDAPKMEFLK